MKIQTFFVGSCLAVSAAVMTADSAHAYTQNDCDFWQSRLQITVVNSSCTIEENSPVLFSVSCSGTSRCSATDAAYISKGAQHVFSNLISGTSKYSSSTESCEQAQWNTYIVAPVDGNSGGFALDASIYQLTATCTEDVSGPCGCSVSK